MGRIDLHSHLLPGIDDGPETMEETLAMARVAAADGTDAIVATPHQRDVMMRASVQQIRELVSGLNEALDAETAPGDWPLRVLTGMENHIEPNLPAWLDEGRALTLNGTKFILAEPPFTSYPPYVDEVLFKLQAKRLVPVIAHPERNTEMQRRPDRLRALIGRGMLAQVTAGSFLGVFGPQVQRAAETFARRGLAHMVSSDMHRPGGNRSPHLEAAFNRVADLVGEDRARMMFEDTPRLVIEGRDPYLEPPGEDRASRRWWFLGRIFSRV